MSRRRRLLLAVGAVLVVGAAFGLYWFQPWKSFVDRHVHEALPSVALEAVPVRTSPPGPSPSASPTAPPTAPVLVSRGTLISHEHATSGTVSVVRRPDGSRILAIAHLNTSDGPDVHVWLSNAPVLKGEKGWYVFGHGTHVDLGSLKGNIGDQFYVIPPRADLGRLTSVAIWCQRFDVSFGAARLRPV